MFSIDFVILGIPQPQGSIRTFVPKGSSKAVLTSDNKNLKPWRQDVGWMAKDAMNTAGLRPFKRPAALCLKANFFFPRPKSEKKGKIFKTTKPDQDKLLRSLCDALTGICYEDDAQISQSAVGKFFVTEANPNPRTEVTIVVLDSPTRGE